jgi:squalene-associated FAD-dependent desaturase
MSAGRVIVIGGGLAGIAAALDCAAHGAEVTLLEARGRLGGAAYSFQRAGLEVDNGQHVFLRCCTAYRQLIARLDAQALVTLQPRLSVAVLAPGGRRGYLRRTGLPAPLHLAGSLARYPYIGWRERLALAWAMQRLRAVDINDPAADMVPFGRWLAAQRQSRNAVAAIWELITRPTLNLGVDEASLAQAAQVFQVGLLSDAAAADIGWAVAPLSEIHDRAAARALARAGVQVHLRAGAQAVSGGPGDGFLVSGRAFGERQADAVVVALSPGRTAQIVPAAAGLPDGFAAALGSSAILNLHVVYDRKVLEHPFAATLGTPLQWIFDRSTSSGLREGQYLAVSLSAADAERHDSAAELRARYLPELAALLPAARGAQVREFFVTREHAATFRAAPGARAWRPGPRTRIDGLLLAGAWTDTGWPATMEGAVRSGQAAAHAALAGLRGVQQTPREASVPR